MQFKRGLLLILTVILLITTIGCDSVNTGLEIKKDDEDTETVTGEGPVEGGQIILPLTPFNTLNPLVTENRSYYQFSKLIYESLFEFDSNLNVVGQLAESYNIKNDGKTVEIKLKDNIFWHDGERFKPEDIVFTLNTIKYANKENLYGQMFAEALGPSGTADIRGILDISIIDDRNIIVNFSKEFSNNLELLTFPIIPEHIFNEGRTRNNNFAKALALDGYKVVGTGPFKFDSYEKMKKVTLKANDQYRNGRPYIDKIIGRILETEEDILTAFETGQINMATTVGVDWDKYSQNSRINILEFVSSDYEFLGFNFSKEIFSGESGQRLRRAIAYGIDRQAIIQTIYLGHGTQTDVPIHPDSWLVSEEQNSYGYNIEAAKKELAKLGWEDRDGNGMLTNIDGEGISLEILTNNYNPMRLKTAEMIRDDLLALGIDVKIKSEDMIQEDISQEDREKQWEKINDQLGRGDYDMVLMGWQLSLIPELSFAFHSSQISNNKNFIKYSNEKMDRILEEATLSANNEDKKKSYEKIQKHIVEDLPYMSLFFKNKALLVDSKIIGDLDPVFSNPYRGIENSYIPEELQ